MRAVRQNIILNVDVVSPVQLDWLAISTEVGVEAEHLKSKELDVCKAIVIYTYIYFYL